MLKWPDAIRMPPQDRAALTDQSIGQPSAEQIREITIEV